MTEKPTSTFSGCISSRNTYQHRVDVETPVDRREVHQVLSCEDLEDTEEKQDNLFI